MTKSFFRIWGNQWSKKSTPTLRYFHTYADFIPELKDNEDIVIYSGRLPSQINSYVETYVGSILKSVNGSTISSIQNLLTEIQKIKNDYVVFEFHSDNNPIVLPRQETEAENKIILEKYDVTPAYLLKPERPEDVTLSETKNIESL